MPSMPSRPINWVGLTFGAFALYLLLHGDLVAFLSLIRGGASMPVTPVSAPSLSTPSGPSAASTPGLPLAPFQQGYVPGAGTPSASTTLQPPVPPGLLPSTGGQ